MSVLSNYRLLVDIPDKMCEDLSLPIEQQNKAQQEKEDFIMRQNSYPSMQKIKGSIARTLQYEMRVRDINILGSVTIEQRRVRNRTNGSFGAG